MSDPAANKERTRKWLTEFHKIEGEEREKLYDETYSPTCVLMQGPKRDEKAGHLSMIKDSFEASFGAKDWKTEIQFICAEGNSVMAHYTITAMQTAEFAGLPNSGKRIPVNCMSRTIFNDEGKGQKIYFFMDMESLMAMMKGE
jgi:predicted ester cyclase